MVDRLTLCACRTAEVWHKMLGRARQNRMGRKTLLRLYPRQKVSGGSMRTFGRELRPGYRIDPPRRRVATLSSPMAIWTRRATYPANLLLAYSEGQFVNLTSGSIYAEFDRALNCSTETIVSAITSTSGWTSTWVKWLARCSLLRDGDPHGVDEITGVLDTLR